MWAALRAHDGVWPVAGACAAAVGALSAVPLPTWVLVAAGALAVARRRPVTWCLLLLVVTDVLAVRALDGLAPPPDGEFDGVVTLVTDPEPTTAGRLRFEVTTTYGRLLAEVGSPRAMASSAPLLAGDRVHVEGATGALRRSTDWTRSRHLAGTLRVDSVLGSAPGGAHHTAANAFRRTLDRGAASLTPTQRSLLAGLVLGDDRAQPPQLTADFRAAGLTHLLAVSGQNVAFVLVVVSPLLRMLRLWPRFLVAAVVISSFALVTRFEPSVLRAAFVAVVALYAHTTGRPSGGVRHLALAVCMLLVVDPLLVESLGFRLSVAASIGVLVIAPRLAAWLRGPRWYREGLAVTVGAQCAVAPVLIPTLGPMPLAALPANLAAGPLAGALMVWGLTAGTLAGMIGGRPAWLLHRPSALALDVLELVAGAGASLPTGTVDLRHLTLLAVGVGIVGRAPPSVRVVGFALAAVVMIAPILSPEASGSRPAGWAATVWADGHVAVVDLDVGADPVVVMETLRDAHVRAVALVVVRSSRPTMLPVLDTIASRFPVGAVIGPAGLGHPDLVVVPDGFRARVRRFEIVVDQAGPPMRVRIGWSDGGEVASQLPAVGSPSAPGVRRPRLRRDPPSRRGRLRRGRPRRSTPRSRCRGGPHGGGSLRRPGATADGMCRGSDRRR